MNETQKNEKIQSRTLRFSIKLVKFIIKINKLYEIRVLLDQVMRSGTSVGANLEEADSAVSKKDFINKIAISKKEARETKYWLTIIKDIDILKNQSNLDELNELLNEIEQIIKIIGAIHSRSRSN
jgi:four helix bundle protein